MSSFVKGTVPAVRNFFEQNGLGVLVHRFDWVDSVEALQQIEISDPSLHGVDMVLKDKFIKAVRKNQRPQEVVYATPGPMKQPDERKVELQHDPLDYENQVTIRRIRNGYNTTDFSEDYVNQETIERTVGAAESGSSASDDVDHAYVNKEAVQLAMAGGVPLSKQDEDFAAYENQESIDLHKVDAHQDWMHGRLDRQAAESRLLSRGNGAGTFLVRMKGITGKLYVFSVLIDSQRKVVKHNLIQFTLNDVGTVLIDNKPLSRPCVSLKNVVDVLKKIHSQKLVPAGSQCFGLTDFLIRDIREKESQWMKLTCTRAEAEHYLAMQPPGVFIVRTASTGGLCFSVRLSGNQIYNGQIYENNHGYEVGKTTLRAPSLPYLARALMINQNPLKSCGVNVKLIMPV